MPLLEVKDLNVYYGDFQVLKGISLDHHEKEILGIVGANSAGKSTLLKAISAEIPAARGEILFQQTSITGRPAHEVARRGIIQVPEGRRVFPLMSVLENLFIGSVLPEAKKKRMDTLEKVFSLFPILKERKEQIAGTLSGGEQQMLAIARALMALPLLLMLDEPSIGLAPIMVEIIFRVIQEINGQGMTLLLVEQNVQKSLSVSHRACILENGKLVMEGKGKELLANPYIKEAYLGL